MLKRGVVLTVAVIGVVGAAIGVARAGIGPIAWQSSGDPTVQKIVELAANTAPPESNFDCTPITVRAYGTHTMGQDCVTSVPFGLAGANGMIFNGTTDSIPVVAPRPFFGMQAVPNQPIQVTYTSSSVLGNYLHFYRTIYDKLKSQPDNVNGVWQYTLTKNPDVTLRDSTGKSIPANISAMAFSSNGEWMVVDLPWQGFVRVSLRTFEIVPFAPSQQQNNDYSSRKAQIAVSNDGRTVVVKPATYDFFKVYDLSNCGGATLPVAPGADRCASRDYYPFVNSKIAGLKAIVQPRFISDVQLSFTAIYGYSVGNYKVATFTMTAPGESRTGIGYLGMGDSFASGQGAFAYVNGTDTFINRCHLSSRSYGFLLASKVSLGGHAVSCSGAVMNDITNESGGYKGQVYDGIVKDNRSDEFLGTIINNFTPGFLAQSEFIDKYRPDAVTLSIGGNDIGFGGIVQSCVSPFTLQESCFPTYEDRLELANQINRIFDRLVSTYHTVAKPGKRVYIIGYPQIAMPGGDCAVNVRLDNHEVQMAADLIDYLNLVINRAADKAGVRYVDVSNAFEGHRLCETVSSDVAVNGITIGDDAGVGSMKFLGSESYHPNALGHRLLEEAILKQTNGLQQQMPAANATVGAPALPLTLDERDLPKSGRPVSTLVSDDKMAPDLLTRDQDVNVVLDTSVALFKAFTVYDLYLHSDPVKVGTATTDAAGNLSTTIHIPANTTPGFHTLHVTGPNMVGQPLDAYKTVFVAASPDDYNGDGVPNTAEPCGIVDPANKDNDQDGVDDACDPLIGYSPEVPSGRSGLTARARLAGNTITINLSQPIASSGSSTVNVASTEKTVTSPSEDMPATTNAAAHNNSTPIVTWLPFALSLMLFGLLSTIWPGWRDESIISDST